jgi:hypothetical protein
MRRRGVRIDKVYDKARDKAFEVNGTPVRRLPDGTPNARIAVQWGKLTQGGVSDKLLRFNFLTTQKDKWLLWQRKHQLLQRRHQLRMRNMFIPSALRSQKEMAP